MIMKVNHLIPFIITSSILSMEDTTRIKLLILSMINWSFQVDEKNKAISLGNE